MDCTGSKVVQDSFLCGLQVSEELQKSLSEEIILEDSRVFVDEDCTN